MKYISLAFLTLLLFSTVVAQENLIHNGDFKENVTTNWELISNGAQASVSAELERMIIAIETHVNNEAAPQIIQRNIPVSSGEGYTLSFKASADDTGSIRVFVMTEGNVLYSDSIRGKVSVSTVGKMYSLTFFVPEATGNAKVVFNCGLSEHLTRVSLDSISLVQNTEPMINIIEPEDGARWISGTERHIVWQNSGVLDVVKILFSSDNGSSWTTVADAASNQKSFWWNIPNDISGTECRIIVSDTAGTCADTTGPFSIVAAGTIDAREMIKNGAFLDTTNWYFSLNGSAKAYGAFENDEYIITVDTAGEEPWQVKLEQSGLTLENGSMYRLTFDAYASHERQIYANVGADNGNPSWSVFGGDSIPITITTTRKTYYQTILMKYPTTSNIRVEFNCANDTGTVHIDNVSLVQMEHDDVLIVAPSLGTVLKSGEKTTIEWHAAEVATINLEYSIDSGETWTSLAEGADNLGALSWNVPEVSSETCFIRILDADGDSVIGQSSLFIINAFGTPVPRGELVVNGSFTNNAHGWNTRFDGAQGQGSVENQMFKLSVDQPGDALNTIILSQTNLPVLSDDEYTFSCKAFANGTRMMGVKVITESDATELLDTIVNLPMLPETLTFNFTAENDAIVRIEFHLGGSRAGVFLDDIHFYTGQLVGVETRAGIANISRNIFSVGTGRDRITFITPRAENGVVIIYTLNGKQIHAMRTSGTTTVWNKKTASGVQPACGSYIARYMNSSSCMSKRFIIR